MSHVDEGTLHAYLDGELSPDERAAVESHFSQCGSCRATLAEERTLRERASAVLRSAQPVERPAPPLEQLRRGPTRSPWRVRRSIAWAASIVLAIGIGYSIRGVTPRAVSNESEDRFGLYARRDAPAEQDQAPTAMQPQRNTRATARQPAPAGYGEFRQREADSLSATARVAGRAEPITREEAPSAQAVAPASVSVVGARADSAARIEARNQQQLDAVVVTGRAAAKTTATAPAPRLFSTLTEWPIITRGAARSLLGTDPVGLPGLATRSIRRSPGTDRTVVVEQAVDSATVIQIIQRPATLNYSNDSSAGYAHGHVERQAANRLARFVGPLRVEILGTLPLDSLNRLLEQVAPLPF